VAGPAVPIERMAGQCGAEVRYLPYEGELAGMLARSGDTAVIGVNSRHHRNRQRFTIAHELAHLVLHDLEVHIDRDFRVGLREVAVETTEGAMEIEANRLAVELLMPYDMMLQDVGEAGIDFEGLEDVGPLSRRYGVSRQVMMHRLARIGLV
jgi:Zn-dependent peptidase ImmA (M78 family)